MRGLPLPSRHRRHLAHRTAEMVISAAMIALLRLFRHQGRGSRCTGRSGKKWLEQTGCDFALLKFRVVLIDWPDYTGAVWKGRVYIGCQSYTLYFRPNAVTPYDGGYKPPKCPP